MKKKKTDCTIYKFYKLISGKKIGKKKKGQKTHMLLENNQTACMSRQKKNTDRITETKT